MSMKPMTEAEAVAQLRRFVAALEAGDRRTANTAAFALIAARPPLGDRWQLIARVMQTNGEISAASAAMQSFVDHHRGHPQVAYLQAAMLAQCGRLEQAWSVIRNVPPSVPDPSQNGFLRGTIALNLGLTDLAESILQATLDANPALGQAMLALVSARKRNSGDPVGERILQSAPLMRSAPAIERSHFHFAAGRVHFDRNETDAAFDHFAQGAAIASTERPYEAKADAREAEACRDGFDRAFVADINAGITIDTSQPIFVTGLPRSGTTLVEQILVSHSAVSGGEELGRMAILQRDLGSLGAAGLNAYLARGGKADDLAALYLHLGQERFGQQGRFVDKALNTSRFMGLIAALLPQAPVIWLRRDPVDCAWSAFRTYFIHGLDWSWKLEDIASHFALEDQLFQHWSEMFPERILVVDYQTLVRSPKTEIPRILQHCRLAAEPQVFRPHETKRVVSTASAMQVREPINTGAIGAADPYRTHLAPFIKRYSAITAAAPATP